MQQTNCINNYTIYIIKIEYYDYTIDYQSPLAIQESMLLKLGTSPLYKDHFKNFPV